MSLSAEDKAIRATGIGASEAWKVVLRQHIYEVYERLVHPERVKESTSLAARKGNVLEPFAAELYAERVGLPRDCLEKGATVRHGEFPFVLATPDAYVHHARDDHRLAEFKAPTIHTRKDWGPDGSDEFPLKYRIQCTVQMAVTGLRTCDLVALIEGEDAIRVYPVPWDQELAELVIGDLVTFWHEHISARVPPPVDGSESASDFLAKEFPKHHPDLIDPNLEHRHIAKQLHEVRLSIAQLEAREAELVNLAKARTADAAGVKGLWSWKLPKNGSGTVSWKSVALELGASKALIARHTSPPSRVFRLFDSKE